jgi:hypothetical protein
MHMKKVLLAQLPLVLEQALAEQLRAVSGLEITGMLKNETPDLVVTGGNGGVFTACPVLPLSLGKPQRLGALLRQIGQMLLQPTLYMGDIPLGPYTFKPQEKTLERADGEEIALTDREVDILAYLARHGGNTVSRDSLLKNVWQYQEGVDTHTLETHIYRLRQKMEISADAPRFLVTAEGGYCLRSGA